MNIKNRFIIINALLLLALGVEAQGVQFFKGSWQETLELAKKENKLIFMDAYTTWCGPCKKMAREIFPQKEVGNFYNQKFINVKIDMEKGEGTQLARQYAVEVYPTLLFIDAEGTLLHRAAGYHNEAQFVELGNIAADPSQNITALAKRFESGDRTPSFLKHYAQVAMDAYDGSHGVIAQAYLGTQKDWNTEENRTFIMQYCDDSDSKMFDFLMNNKDAFIQDYGENEVLGKIQNIVYNKINNTPNIGLDEVSTLFEKAYPERADELSSKFRMTYYRNQGDRDGFATSAFDHYKKYPSKDAMELNDVAWTFYEAVNNKDHLKQAVKLAKQSVKLEKAYSNMDTLAALYKKLGKKGKALSTAKKAIKIAKANNEDYSITEELLQEIQDM